MWGDTRDFWKPKVLHACVRKVAVGMSVASVEFNPIGCFVETTGHQKFGESNFWDVGSSNFLPAIESFFEVGPL